MIGRALALAAAVGLAASPCAAADLTTPEAAGERRSGASAGVYFAMPFGGERSGRARAGLRLRMDHQYRDASGRTARAGGPDALELRLLGEERPTLFVADMPVTGRDARNNMFGGGGIVTIVIIGLAVVGAVVIMNELDDDDDEPQPAN